MEHHNNIAKKLFESPDRYAPLFAVDKRNGDILWELWIEGFEKAFKLRPTAWQPLLDADVNAAKAMSGLLTLCDVARRDPCISKTECDALAAVAHERIGDWVLTLNEWRLENYDPKQGKSTPPPAMHGSPGKVGRNDPCPCGSGKKYKKCCGLN
jgi:uncharacterized protein